MARGANGSMTNRRASVALAAVLMTPALPATAQQSAVQADSARAQIHTSLRAFYFNLAHQDWEALSADILPAKVVAHRPAPEAMVMAAASRDRGGGALSPTNESVACSSKATALVGQASIALDGDWAEVSVPRCTVALAGADEFRLIHFEGRWRFVYISLFEAPTRFYTDR